MGIKPHRIAASQDLLLELETNRQLAFCYEKEVAARVMEHVRSRQRSGRIVDFNYPRTRKRDASQELPFNTGFQEQALPGFAQYDHVRQRGSYQRVLRGLATIEKLSNWHSESLSEGEQRVNRRLDPSRLDLTQEARRHPGSTGQGPLRRPALPAQAPQCLREVHVEVDGSRLVHACNSSRLWLQTQAICKSRRHKRVWEIA